MTNFHGFSEPMENWSKLPNQFIDALPLIETLAEMKVILYILRHTWGYHDDKKRISASEFSTGRRRRDGTTIDNGIGMNEPAVRDGLRKAEEHGFISVEIDDSDGGRIKKYYSLAGVDDQPPEGGQSTPSMSEVNPRSEKETSGNTPEKTTTTAAGATGRSAVSPPVHKVNTGSRGVSTGGESGDMSQAEPQVFTAKYTRSVRQPETIVACALCKAKISDHHHDACPDCHCPVIWNSSYQADQRRKAREQAEKSANLAQDSVFQSIRAIALQFPSTKALNGFKFNAETARMRQLQDQDGSSLIDLAQRLARHPKANAMTAGGFLAWLSNVYTQYGPNAYKSDQTIPEAKPETVYDMQEKDGHLWKVPITNGQPDWTAAEQVN